MTIVAAIDRSKRSKKIIEHAGDLGEAFGEDVHVVHVLSQGDFVEMQQTAVEESGQPVDMDQIRDVAADIAEDASEGITGEFMPVGLVGDAAREILRYADNHDARYIVVGGRKRSPVGKVLFGSVTQSVLLGADRPVVTIIRSDEEPTD